MPRGRYALVALAHVLLLGGLLWGMVWGELNYLPPVSALACLVGMGTLCSLVAITIRRMRDAGLPSVILLAPLAWGAALVHCVITELWLALATPMSAELPQLYSQSETIILMLCGGLFVPLTMAMLCAPTRKKHREQETRVPGFFCNFANGLAASFHFGGRATRREFWLFIIPAYLAAAVVLYFSMFCLITILATDGIRNLESSLFETPVSSVFVGIYVATLLPLLSITFRRARDAGHFRRWLTALFFLVLGAVLYVWVIVPATYFPHESSFATFYVFSAYPLYLPAFLLYSLYVFIKPGEK